MEASSGPPTQRGCETAMWRGGAWTAAPAPSCDEGTAEYSSCMPSNGLRRQRALPQPPRGKEKQRPHPRAPDTIAHKTVTSDHRSQAAEAERGEAEDLECERRRKLDAAAAVVA